MEFNLFIVPVTMILTELLKQYIPSKFIPLLAVTLGLVMGIFYGVYYGQDLFVHGFQGIVYGASATGLYHTGQRINKGVNNNE
ncbi:holin [Facklamia miroungae]|uniref:Phage holin family Hol44, holin superfamily V n=1 Tax=Facklamia miroungae TaxID=120956 RepID=A0A1G7P163_9LACT|nr:holin [Facklamia miroungae]NKZ28546.1 holin [Facklamia miroungae]SDF80035.1 Phage holin family Hol44, holin superfamily V [Facklamia miroungae]